MTGRARQRPSAAVTPAARLAVGLAGLALAGRAARADHVQAWEVNVFRTFNQLPDALGAPTWLVMQGGNLVAVPVAAWVAAASGRPLVARRILVAGVSTWALAKVVKQRVRRPRPTVLLAHARSRGRPQSGLGFVSGHAGVATALCTAALPELGPRGRRLAVAATTAIALSRLYVGAHLPLDVVGGAALGLVVEATVDLFGGTARAELPVPNREADDRPAQVTTRSPAGGAR